MSDACWASCTIVRGRWRQGSGNGVSSSSLSKRTRIWIESTFYLSIEYQQKSQWDNSRGPRPRSYWTEVFQVHLRLPLCGSLWCGFSCDECKKETLKPSELHRSITYPSQLTRLQLYQCKCTLWVWDSKMQLTCIIFFTWQSRSSKRMVALSAPTLASLTWTSQIKSNKL